MNIDAEIPSRRIQMYREITSMICEFPSKAITSIATRRTALTIAADRLERLCELLFPSSSRNLVQLLRSNLESLWPRIYVS